MKSGFGEDYLKSQDMMSRPYLIVEMSGQPHALVQLDAATRRNLKELGYGQR